MNFDFSNIELFNPVYIPLLHDNNRYKILYGGRDSGKSDFIAQHTIIDLIKDVFFRQILLRKYYANIKQSQFQTILDYIRLWELSDLFHVTLNPLFIACKHNGNQILARGLDQPDNTKSIKDPTSIWYEEADQISEEAFTEASISLRSSANNVKITEWFSFNPRKESHWLNKLFFPLKNTYEKEDGKFHFVKSPRANTTILHTNFRDNKFITKERVERLESLKLQDDNYYKVNTLGLWGGAVKGLIFPDWTAVDDIPQGGDEILGLDYGFNDPAALVLVSYKEKKLFVKELVYVTNHTHQQLVNLLIADYQNLLKRKRIIVDSAVPELIKALRSAGFNALPAEKGPDSVYKGILATKQFDLHITKDSQNLIREIQSYCWKESREGRVFDEAVDVDNHALDALRYTIQTYGTKHWMNTHSNNSYARKERANRDYFSGY